MAIKLEVALRQLHEAHVALGRIPADAVVSWQCDHNPALGLRPVDAKGQHVPHQHSPAHLEWLHTVQHKVKTTGRRGESKLSLRDGDQAKIAKTDRIVRAREALAEAEKRTGDREADRRAGKPKAKIPRPPKKKAEPQRRASGYVRRGV